MASADENIENYIEVAWLEEVQRREREIMAGQACWICYEDAMGSIQKIFSDRVGS